MTLETRTGLPDALRMLVRDYPRDIWESHRNFDALTRFWLERHLMFRQMLARIEAETQRYLDGGSDARVFSGASARLIGTLLNELQGHHQIEDVQYFPRLAALEPRLEAGFALLDADHHALDGHIHALADTTNALLRALQVGPDRVRADRVGADRVGLDRVEAGRLLDQVSGFGRFIDRHLVDEEELVIPTILHHAPDW